MEDLIMGAKAMPNLALIEGLKSRLETSKGGKFLRAKEVAELMGLSVPTVWRLHRLNPAFPRCFKFSHKITVWDANEVIEFVKSSRLH